MPLFPTRNLVPIIGMLCGATLSGISVSVTYVLKELEYVSSLFPSVPCDVS